MTGVDAYKGSYGFDDVAHDRDDDDHDVNDDEIRMIFAMVLILLTPIIVTDTLLLLHTECFGRTTLAPYLPAS